MKKSSKKTIATIEAKYPKLYDFSHWDEDHVGSTTPVKTCCRVCGHIFYPTPSDLSRGKHKCKPCSDIAKFERNKEEFFKVSKKIHKGRYDYSKVNYVDSQTKVLITCQTHGDFLQIPAGHKQGKIGCKGCLADIKSVNNRLPFDELIRNLKESSKTECDYSKIKNKDYINQKSIVTITCKKHGDFTQSIANHLQGKNGCIECQKELAKITNNQYIEDCQKMHNGFYDYSHTEYAGSDMMLENIICPVHGYFDQRADSHKAGNACRFCYNSRYISLLEQKVFDFVSDLNASAIQSNRSILNGKELDIYVTDRQLAIEFCGIYWHTEFNGKYKNYHKEKYDQCANQGIRLITIFEDEWNARSFQIKEKLKLLLGHDDRKTLYARNTIIKTVSREEKSLFFDRNHIQGDGSSSINYGLFLNGQIVACMGFTKHANGVFYLNRYASSSKVIGGMQKLVTHFKRNNVWSKIISFADLRWSDGKIYTETKWQLDKILLPDYSYYYKGNRYDKRKFRKKYLNSWFGDGYDPLLTERENCSNNKAYRIWDCGMHRYILKNESYNHT